MKTNGARAIALVLMMLVPLALAGATAAEDDDWGLSHLNPVPTERTLYSAAWKPYGAYAVIGGERGTALACNGTAFYRFNSGTQETLRAAAWRPDASGALLAGNAGTVRAFDGTALTPVVPVFAYDLRAACWSPDGSQAILVGTGGTALKFNGTLSSLTTGVNVDILGAAWAPNGSYALLVGRVAGGSATILKYNGSAFSTVPNTIAQDMRAVAWNPNGSEALVVGSQGRAYRFNGATFTTIPPAGGGQNLQAVAWSPNGTFALISGDGGTLLRYQGGALTPVTTGTGNNLYGVCWELSGEFALIAGSAGTVLKYSPAAVSRLSADATGQDLNDVEWHPGGSYALLVGTAGTILKYDGLAFTTVISGVNQELRGISWHPNGSMALIVGRSSGGPGAQWRILKYDNSTGLVTSIQGPGGALSLWDVAYSPDGKQALLVGNNHVVLRYDGSAVTNLNCPIGSEWHGAAWRPDGSSALIVGARGSEVVNATPGAPWTFSAVSNNVYNDLNRVQWRNNTYALVSGIVDPNTNRGTLLRYDLTLPAPLGALTNGALDELWGIGWKPGGNYSLVAGLTATVLKFDLATCTTLPVPTAEDLLGVGWRPDGSYAVVVGTAGTVLKWSPSGFAFTNTPPAAAITAPADTATVSGTVAVCGTASDPDAAPHDLKKVLVWVDDGAPFVPSGLSSWGFNLDTGLLANGNHTISALAMDSWSNSPAARVTVKVDNFINTPPLVNITAPLEGAVVSGTVNVTGHAQDPDAGDSVARVMVKAGAASWLNSTGTSDWYYLWDTGTVADGNCTLSAMAYDAYALLPSQEFIVNVTVRNAPTPDLPPVVVMDAPVEGANVSGAVVIRGTASDPDAGDTVTTVFVRIDASGNWNMAVGTNSWNLQWDTTSVPNGLHTLYARAINDHLNFSVEAVRNVTVGNINLPPIVTITSPVEGDMVNGTVTISGTAHDQEPAGTVASVFFRIDSGPWTAVTGTANWSVAWNTTMVLNGPHNISAIAFDGALNSSLTSVGIIVNNTAPAPPVAVIASISPNPAARGQAVSFVGSGQTQGAVVAYQWTSSIDGQLSTQASFNTTSLSAGSHTIRLRVQDNAGQWSVEASIVLVVTTGAPGARVITLSAGGDRSCEVGQSLSFLGTASVSEGRLVRYFWNFGDGKNWTSANNSQVGHSYAKTGTYKATFQVWDELGNTATAEVNVVVKAVATTGNDYSVAIAVAALLLLLMAVILLILFRTKGNGAEPQEPEPPAREERPAREKGPKEEKPLDEETEEPKIRKTLDDEMPRKLEEGEELSP